MLFLPTKISSKISGINHILILPILSTVFRKDRKLNKNN